MGKYDEFIKKQETFLEEIEKSRNGINHELYRELVNLDRASVSNMKVSPEKYEENGKEYNLYSKEGFAYKYTLVFLYDFLLSNGFQLPDLVLEKYNLVANEITFYKTILESKGNFDFSTIKYIMSIDLGLREQMKEIFGEEIITEEFFPKFNVVKSNLETIKVIFKETKRKLIIKNFSPDELKMAYTTAMEQRVQELESQLVMMKDKIEKEGVFTLDNHPQYKKFQAEYDELKQRIVDIKAIVEPQKIEELRASLISKITDYQSKYRELEEGKKLKGIKDKETLEKEKTSVVESIANFSNAGSEKKKIDDDIKNIKLERENLKKMSDLYNAAEDLKDLIEEYEKQSKKVQNTKDEIENLKQEKTSTKKDYDDEISRFVKLNVFKRLSEAKKSNEITHSLAEKIKKLDKENKEKEEEEKKEEEVLNKFGEQINKKIEELQKKHGVFNQFFPQGTSGNIPEWKVSVQKFEECSTKLENVMNNSSKEILTKESEIRTILGIPPTIAVTEQSISMYISQLIQKGNQDVQNIEKALKFSTLEEQQPGYFENLEIGVSLAEEELASRKR